MMRFHTVTVYHECKNGYKRVSGHAEPAIQASSTAPSPEIQYLCITGGVRQGKSYASFFIHSSKHLAP